MKDFLGRDLAVDDHVVLTQPQYRNFVVAKIIRFTPKKVVVEYTYQGYTETYTGEPSFLVKIV